MVAELVVGWYHIMGCTIRVSPLDYVLFAYPGIRRNALGQTCSTLLRVTENLQESAEVS